MQKNWIGGECRSRGERRGTYRVLVKKPEGKRPFGRPRRRLEGCKWEDNIKMYLQEVGWGMDWIDLAQDRHRWQAFLKKELNPWVP